NKLDGVAASVNYATEKAKVTAPEGYDPQLLVAEVEKTGYTAALPKHATPAGSGPASDEEDEADPELTSLRHRLIGAVVLTVPVARGAGDRLGGLAVPQGGRDEPQARRGDDGHAHLDGHLRGAAVVAVCAVLRHRRNPGDDPPVRADDRPVRRRSEHLPRSRRRRDDVHPPGPLLREEVQAPGGSRIAGPARAGGERGLRAARGPGAEDRHRGSRRGR